MADYIQVTLESLEKYHGFKEGDVMCKHCAFFLDDDEVCYHVDCGRYEDGVIMEVEHGDS